MEIAALLAAGLYGWHFAGGARRLVLAVALPLALAAVWGTFAVPGDPSRSGGAPVPVPGWLRLFLEMAIFAFAAWALWAVGATVWSLVLVGLTAAHYLFSLDRIAWLLTPSSVARGRGG